MRRHCSRPARRVSWPWPAGRTGSSATEPILAGVAIEAVPAAVVLHDFDVDVASALEDRRSEGHGDVTLALAHPELTHQLPARRVARAQPAPTTAGGAAVRPSRRLRTGRQGGAGGVGPARQSEDWWDAGTACGATLPSWRTGAGQRRPKAPPHVLHTLVAPAAGRTGEVRRRHRRLRPRPRPRRPTPVAARLLPGSHRGVDRGVRRKGRRLGPPALGRLPVVR